MGGVKKMEGGIDVHTLLTAPSCNDERDCQ